MKNTRKIKRQQVKVIVARVSPWDLTGSSDSIYRSLKDTENLYLTENSDVIKAEWDWESPSSDDHNGSFILEITRLENDKEYNARVNRLMKIKENEKSAKEKEEQRELEEYLRLKKKFGDNYLHKKYDDIPYSALDKNKKLITNPVWQHARAIIGYDDKGFPIWDNSWDKNNERK